MRDLRGALLSWIQEKQKAHPDRCCDQALLLSALRGEVERHIESPHVVAVCMACEDSEDGYSVPVPWPCPTLKRLAESLGVKA